jgi:hypothetical protein
MTLAKRQNFGAGCLALFALPFAAVGAVALYLAGSAIWTWHEMQTWVAVPADLLTVDLEEHEDDEGATTYEVVASYRYEYDGHDYASDRVAISNFADNVGDFHQTLYRELAEAQWNRRPVTAYIDPANPADATLSRDPRWLLTALKAVFGLVFGGVGVALLFGARIGAKTLAAERELANRFPKEPWRWRKEWTDGRIRGSNRGTAYAAIGFAVLWNLISLPAVLLVPREVADGDWIALVALLFPAAGIGLAAWAVRQWLVLRRFKVATLVLQRVPVALGGRLRGEIRIDTHVPIEREFKIELACVERVRGARNRDSREDVRWQSEFTVPKHRCQLSSTYSAIPIDIPVPADQPPTSEAIQWRLDATGICPGPDFWTRFDLPLFAIDAERARDQPVAPALGIAQAAERPDPAILGAHGIAFATLPNGGESWTFGRARNKQALIIITSLSTVWSAIALALVFSDAPLIFPVAFGLFDAILVWWMLSLWLTEFRITVDARSLRLEKRGFGGRKPIEIPRAQVRRIGAERGMQAGNKLYYDLRVETTDGRSHTAAGNLADQSVASWLANHLMATSRA